MWEEACNWTNKLVALAAPRGHAKSTAITHAFTLACIAFMVKKYIIVLSDTEGQAVLFLQDIKNEFAENELLQQMTGFKGFQVERETDIIMEFEGGHLVRVVAKGSEQKLRGMKWRGKRPDLVIGDDLENDEIVLNEERRTKFRTWMLKAVLPMLSDDGHIRIVGTILHLDSFLNRVMPTAGETGVVETPLKRYTNNTKRAWRSVLYRAHPDVDDYQHILWREKWSEERLKALRQAYVDDGHPEGYSQEFLNNPVDESLAFFRRGDLIDLSERQTAREVYYAAGDLAVSEKDGRAYTVFAVVGVDDQGIVRTRDIRRFRGDGHQIIEEMFSIQARYDPEIFILEEENIAKTLGPFLHQEMRRRGIYIRLHTIIPSKDKLRRARSLQARLRAGGWEFDTDAEWFPALQQELLYFPRAPQSDQVDALSWIAHVLDQMIEAPTEQALEEREYQDMLRYSGYEGDGRSVVGGY